MKRDETKLKEGFECYWWKQQLILFTWLIGLSRPSLVRNTGKMDHLHLWYIIVLVSLPGLPYVHMKQLTFKAFDINKTVFKAVTYHLSFSFIFQSANGPNIFLYSLMSFPPNSCQPIRIIFLPDHFNSEVCTFSPKNHSLKTHSQIYNYYTYVSTSKATQMTLIHFYSQ